MKRTYDQRIGGEARKKRESGVVEVGWGGSVCRSLRLKGVAWASGGAGGSDSGTVAYLRSHG